MKTISTTIYLLLASALLMATAQAHEPSEHTAKMEKPKCEAMENMDHSKMGSKDPVMMAMMKKCMSSSSSEEHHAEGEMKHSENETMNHSEKEGANNKTEQHDAGHDH